MRTKVITLSLIVALASQLSSGCCYWRPFQSGCGSSCYQPRPLLPLIPPLLPRPIFNRPILNPQIMAPVGAPAMNYNSFAGPQLPAPAPNAFAYGVAGLTPGCSDCGADPQLSMLSPMPGPNGSPHDYPPTDYGTPNDYGNGPSNDYPGDPLAFPAGYGSNFQPGFQPTVEGNRRVIASTPTADSYPPPNSYPAPSTPNGYPAPSTPGAFQSAPVPMLPAPREMPEEKGPMQ